MSRGLEASLNLSCDVGHKYFQPWLEDVKITRSGEYVILFGLSSFLQDDDYFVNVSDYKVNGESATIKSTTSTVKNGCHRFEQIITLKGATKYEISKLVDKQYSLDKDFAICFRALYIINKFTLSYSGPEDINTNFYSRGTVENFKPFGEDRYNGFTRKHKGLILPNQGYVIALKEI